MSVERSAETVIGYVIPVQDFFKVGGLLQHTPERFHMEKRFDPKSGKEVAPVKIVDSEEHYRVVVRGVDYDGPEVKYYDPENWNPDDDVIEAISEVLDCDVRVTGDFYNGCNVYVCLSSAKMKHEDSGSFTALKEIVKHAKDLERIGKACKKLLGVNPGACGAHSIMFSC